MALYVNGRQVSGGGGGGNTNSIELTYAEYQALTPEQQLDGTEYFITDINGDGQDFQPIIYSEEEREIGVWKDGKPLYEKTLKFINDTDWAVGTVFDTQISDVDYMFIKEANFTDTSVSGVGNLPYLQGGTSVALTLICSTTTKNQIVVKSNSSFTANINRFIIVTVRYTKTTDQAGSGTWTPQGVPAHHYSTGEQVVGTWVDGSTLYEKTITFTAPSSNAYTSQSLGVTVDHVSIIETSIVKGSQVGTLCGAYNGNPANDEWQGFINLTNSTFDYRVGSSYYGGIAYVTIRYTKSST